MMVNSDKVLHILPSQEAVSLGIKDSISLIDHVFFYSWVLTCPVDVSALKRSFERLCSRHEALRVRFKDPGRAVRQIISADTPVLREWAYNDETDVFTAFSDARRTVEDMRMQGLDLEKEVVRAAIVKIGQKFVIVVLMISHLIYDPTSALILWRDWQDLYDQECGKPVNPLPESPYSYSEYVERVTAEEGAALDRSMRFWNVELKRPVEHVVVPTSPAAELAKEPETRSGLGAVVVEVNRSDVTRMSRACHASPFVIMFSGWMGALRKYVNDDRVIVRAIFDGRSEETRNMVGVFVKMVPVVVHIGQADANCVGPTRDGLEAAGNHMEFAYRRIFDTAGVPERAVESDMFSFNLLPESPLAEGRLFGTESRSLLAEEALYLPENRVTFIMKSDIVQTRLDYNTRRHSRADARRLVEDATDLALALGR